MSAVEKREVAGEVLGPTVRTEIVALDARIRELGARLAQNRTKFSRPPSADLPSVVRPAPPPSVPARGGQTGHRGYDQAVLLPERPGRKVPAAVRASPRELGALRSIR